MASRAVLVARAEKRVGQVLCNRWRLERLLEVGGMAAVFEATHRNGNRVAVKLLHHEYAVQEDMRKRFLREGYAANKVGHPGAVTVLDDDELEDGSVFLVMELLEGLSLQKRIDQSQRLPPGEVLHIAERVLDVLGTAHTKDIIHRDIKPGNIFLTHEGEVKVLDFGLARVRERAFDGSLTRSGIVMGTASYMPPEQARAKHDSIDARTDIWAVGATMWKALTGRYVHDVSSVTERLLAAMSQPAPSLGKVAPELPQPLVAVVDRALAFQQFERWPDARTMQRELHRVYEQILGRPMPSVERVVWSAEWVTTRRSPEAAADPEPDLHLSVTFEVDPDKPESIVVEFEDEAGQAGRYTLNRRERSEATQRIEPLSEVTVAERPGARKR